MKTLSIINWIIIGIYSVYAIVAYFSSNRPGIDAAGRGMAMGFLLIGLIYLAVLIVLNFINILWVRILVLLLGGLPILVAANRAISLHFTQKKHKEYAKQNSMFKDPHLNAMMTAVQNSNLNEMESLLAKDNSQINQVGVNNQKTILGIAVRRTWTSDKPEASAIVDLILKNGADPNVYHPSVYAPLVEYGEYIDTSIFKALLEAGANPNALGHQSIPLLYTFIEKSRDDSFEKVELLIKHGLDTNIPLGTEQPYMLNYSPLVYAAHHEKWAICNLFINNGADVNFQPGGPLGSERNFWFILEEKGKAYQESGNIPEDYQQLLSNEKIKNGKKK